ncbi:MAG: HTH-type transcriptional regulator, fmd operon transcriptional regulator [Thermoproteota archaeon]|nr:HTH-type transcriptional regulator, fmd operon transcriptional regulator [Thermoproteota archaeon]
MSKEYGLLSNQQFKVLQLRIERGLSQSEIAKDLGTTRENVTIIEKRAKRNIKLAERTLQIYKLLISLAKIEIEAGTHLIDVPGIVIKSGDSLGIKLNVNFTMMYDEIKVKARDCIGDRRVVKPFLVAIFRDGTIEVIPKSL